jgi:hypothetical protein
VQRILVLAAVGAAVLLAGGVWLRQNLVGPLPSDASLRAMFEEHRGEFDALAARALADAELVGAGHDWMLMRFDVFVRDTPRQDRMLMDREVRSTGRLEYLRLLDRAGLTSVSRARTGSLLWFTVKSNFRARKGIVYSVGPLAPVRLSLDDLERTARGTVPTGYLPLAPSWYLYLTPRD